MHLLGSSGLFSTAMSVEFQLLCPLASDPWVRVRLKVHTEVSQTQEIIYISHLSDILALSNHVFIIWQKSFCIINMDFITFYKFLGIRGVELAQIKSARYLSVVVHTFNPRGEDAGRSVWVLGQFGLYSEFQDIQDYGRDPVLKPKTKTNILPLPKLIISQIIRKKNVCCSILRTRVQMPAPMLHGSLLSITPSPRDPTPSSGLGRALLHNINRYLHIHIKWNNVNVF